MPCLRPDLLLCPHPCEVRAPASRADGILRYKTIDGDGLPTKVKVYLSAPMILNRSLGRASLMARAMQVSGHEFSSPWVLGPLEKSRPGGLNVFERDKNGVEQSDAIVADVTEPSVGVGMEIMAAHKQGKKVIVVVKKGKAVSGMLRDMEPKVTVEYSDESEIYGGLREVLGGT